MYIPIQHDIQGILCGQVITSGYRFLNVIDQKAAGWERYTISSFGSARVGQEGAMLAEDHNLDPEVVLDFALN